MKKYASLPLFLFVANIVLAQITINEFDLIQPGDTFLISVDNNAIVDLGLPVNEPQVWDFSSLVEDSLKFACYGLNNNLVFSDDFPDSNTYTYGPSVLYAGPFGASPANMFGYIMFRTDVNGFHINGYRSDFGYGMTNVYNQQEEVLMPAPFSYGNELVNHASWQVWHNFVSSNPDSLYRRNIYKTFHADAYGTMTTPYGSFEVIRVHETGYYVDSVKGYMGGIEVFSMEFMREQFNNYFFWAKELRQPLAVAYLNEDEEIIKIDFLKTAMYWNNTVLKTKKSIQIFPNPADSYIRIWGEMGSFIVYDSFGRMLKQYTDCSEGALIDVSELEQGVYFIHNTETGEVQRFVKQ